VNETDKKFMKAALAQAKKGLGRTSPNPAVGAVVAKGDRILAKGFHRKAGTAHAEIEVLDKLGGRAPDGTLYVTLEPCNHHGRTPPCTEAILQSGLTRVVVGMKDPNPGVAGGGCDFLRKSGIEVTTGVLETDCRQLNEVYIKFVKTKRPFVMLKSALTMDGWIATSQGDSKWITNEDSRQFVHRLRDQVDAVMVGIGTILADNPSLTTRLDRRRGRDPLRIIVDTHLRTPFNANILNAESSASTLIAVGPETGGREKRFLEKKGVSILNCPAKEGKIDLDALMGILGNMEICSILMEGGASITGSMLREKLVDKFHIFTAPKILGGGDGTPMAAGPGPKRMEQCLRLKNTQLRRFGDNILVTGYPHW
jgi:diaminohydroxyphosphoribosylaminopyrimidine deaminase/5-amino-6-(5-phosphoribosylamino)uracil reductase